MDISRLKCLIVGNKFDSLSVYPNALSFKMGENEISISHDTRFLGKVAVVDIPEQLIKDSVIIDMKVLQCDSECFILQFISKNSSGTLKFLPDKKGCMGITVRVGHYTSISYKLKVILKEFCMYVLATTAIWFICKFMNLGTPEFFFSISASAVVTYIINKMLNFSIIR